MDNFVFQASFPTYEVNGDAICETLSASNIDWVRAFEVVEVGEYAIVIKFECPHSKIDVNYNYKNRPDLASISQLANELDTWTHLWDALTNAAKAPYPVARGATKDPFELSRNSSKDEW